MRMKEKNKLEIILKLFKVNFGNEKSINEKFKSLYLDNEGEWNIISSHLTPKNGFSLEIIKKIHFTYDLYLWSIGNVGLVSAFQKDENINSMRDIALNYNKELLTKKIVEVNAKPNKEQSEDYISDLCNALLHSYPTTVFQNRLCSKKKPFNKKTREGIVAFLNNQPESFNILTASIYEALKYKDAFKGINPDIQEEIIEGLKSIQRIYKFSASIDSTLVLLETGFSSAYNVVAIPESQFIKIISKELGKKSVLIAKQIYANAKNT